MKSDNCAILTRKGPITRKVVTAGFAWLVIALIILNNVSAVGNVTNQEQTAVKVIVDVDKELQTIDGFGVSDAWRAKDIRWLPESQQTEFLNLIFSVDKGAGLSILRHRIDPYFHFTPKLWFPDVLADDVWLTKEARKRGVRWVMASVWTPPAWMKTNNDENNGGHVKKEYYGDFAEYLNQYVKEMAKFGAPVDVISMQNEPDLATSYESCQWDADEAADFIKNYWSPCWLKERRSELPMWGEQSSWQSSKQSLAITLKDPEILKFIKVVGAHTYENRKIGTVTGMLIPENTLLNHIWMTETSNLGPDDPSIQDALNWAGHIHDCLYDGRATAINYWWLFQRYGTDGHPSGEGLVNFEQVGSKVTIHETKRLWSFAQYSRFVRPGARLLMVENTSGKVVASAFISAHNDAIILVLINNSAVPQKTTLTLKGCKLGGKVRDWSTSEAANLQPLDVMMNGSTCQTFLSPYSISTLVMGCTGN